ncbi:hypothetical protein K4F52_002160 [Lecanicillium sp. MT-2017a]|nr:hypothetical protein K4F52_002160 [Lecanicillium sp. MT-2017a]
MLSRALLPLLPLLATLCVAAKHGPGEICHNIKDCTDNCVDGIWTISTVDGTTALVCDAEDPDPTLYYGMRCALYSSGPENDGFNPATRDACTATGGKMCNDLCSLQGKRSNDAELRKKFQEGCRNFVYVEGTKVKFELHALTFVTKTLADERLDCRPPRQTPDF